MSRAWSIAWALAALVIVIAMTASASLAARQSEPSSAHSTVPAAGADSWRFASVDVYVDPAGETLVAWQARISDSSGRIKVVGIEGGEDPSFSSTPTYDPAVLALSTLGTSPHDVLRLAAIDVSGAGPSSKTRVARVHVAVLGDAPLSLALDLETAASSGGPITSARAHLIP
ncbi:MAG: hypothetical protein AAGG01_24570 [Planctomycetota bacterium]